MGITFSICPGRSGVSEEHKTEFNYESVKQEQVTPMHKVEESDQEVDEETKKIKAMLIQTNWKKKKEKQGLIERIRVLDSNLNKLGQYISIEKMKSKIDPRVEEVQSNLKEFKETQEEKTDFVKLTYRQPFQFNLNNSIYHGQWNSEGLREGYGLLVSEDNILMEGLWKEGKLFKGRIFREDGSYFEGQIKDYKADGIGIINFTNGDFYKGKWNDFLQTSNGSRIFNDGYRYEGHFENDEYSEFGRFLWPDGSIYEGYFENSSFKGKGIFRTATGEVYEGEWNNNMPNGSGTYNYAGKNSGITYTGDYKHGKKEGKGKLTFEEDKYYEGEWVNGLPHGQGIYKNQQNSHKGLWRYGFLVFSNSASNSKKEEISVPNIKESFKDKKNLCHLRDQVDGEVIGEEKNKKGKNYKPNEGQDIIKFVSKISKETNQIENYISTAI